MKYLIVFLFVFVFLFITFPKNAENSPIPEQYNYSLIKKYNHIYQENYHGEKFIIIFRTKNSCITKNDIHIREYSHIKKFPSFGKKSKVDVKIRHIYAFVTDETILNCKLQFDNFKTLKTLKFNPEKSMMTHLDIFFSDQLSIQIHH